MKEEKQKRVYKALLDTKGLDNQIIVCIEELAELTKELTKFLREKGNTMNLFEELADVEICTDQLKEIFDQHNGVEFFKDFKLNRLDLFYLQGEEYK